MHIDKVYIINLKHRKDRKIKIIKELARMGITNYEFYTAIKPKQKDIVNWNPQFLNPIPQWFKNTGGDELKYKIGCLGCMTSHIDIIKKSLANNYTNVLILEDDTEFTQQTGAQFQDIMNYLTPQLENLSFGLLYLAGNHRGSKMEKKTDNIVKVEGTYTTGSYIINRSIMEYVVKNVHGYKKEIDVYYAEEIQNKFPCYCIMPHMTKQCSSYSDIVQKQVNYNL